MKPLNECRIPDHVREGLKQRMEDRERNKQAQSLISALCLSTGRMPPAELFGARSGERKRRL